MSTFASSPGSRPARRVCHLRATNFFGGPEKQIVEHVASLDGSDWGGLVATFENDRGAADLARRAGEAGVETFAVAGRSGFDPRQTGHLRDQLERLRIDLLVTHGYRANAVGYVATRAVATPQLAYMRGFTGENLRIRAYESLDRWLLRRMPGVICVSGASRDLLQRSGVPADRLAVVHNAVRFVDSIDPAPLREELGIPQDAPVCVAAGRLSPEKGHRVLVDAMRHLGPEVRCVIFGEGALAAELKHRCRDQGLGDRVHFPGFRSDVMRYLAAATLVVNPSYTEGLPNVLLEALMVGVPVVATAVGGVPELIEEVGGGLTVCSGDAPELASGIRRALSMGPQLVQQAREARQRIRADFSFESQALKLRRIYTRTCATVRQRP